MRNARAFALAAALFSGGSAAAPAEADPPPDLSKPPVVGAMRPYRTPRRLEWRLPNGLEVVLVSDRRYPMVTARLAVRSGSAAVPAESAGLADAMAELLTDGTSRKDSKQIADAAAEYGGTLTASAGPDSIVLETYALAESSERMLALLAEAARSASFPKAEVALRKSNMLEELNVSRAESDFLAGVAFYKKIYGDHPYGITAPNEKSIQRINRKLLSDGYRRAFTPANAVLVLVGHLGLDEAKASLERTFGGWNGTGDGGEAPAYSAGPSPRRVYLVDRPGSSQASIFMGNSAVGEGHPQYFDLLIANQVLGGSFSSRLVQDVRETKGYTYRIGTRLERRLSSSLWRLRTPVRNEAVGAALELIFLHLDRIRNEEATAEELDKAKNFLIGAFARSLETQAGLADALVRLKLHRLPEDYYDTFVEKVLGVGGAGALKAAKDFIRPEEFTVVVVGDASVLRGDLEKFSTEPVAAVDQDGN